MPLEDKITFVYTVFLTDLAVKLAPQIRDQCVGEDVVEIVIALLDIATALAQGSTCTHAEFIAMLNKLIEERSSLGVRFKDELPI